MIGASVYVFGGEDRSRRAVNDLYVLDMASLTWSRPATQVQQLALKRITQSLNTLLPRIPPFPLGSTGGVDLFQASGHHCLRSPFLDDFGKCGLYLSGISQLSNQLW